MCENNHYAQSTPQEYHQKVKDIAKRAEGYGVASEIVDGMDIFQVYTAAQRAVERARKGEGPTFIECKTYLYSGHYVGDAKGYRYKEEMEYYQKERDCIDLFKKAVVETTTLTEEDFCEIDKEVDAEVEAAIQFAIDSPFPEASEVTEHVYSNY